MEKGRSEEGRRALVSGNGDLWKGKYTWEANSVCVLNRLVMSDPLRPHGP